MLVKEVQKTAEILLSGGTVLYPTDTIWGLGCDATNEEAVQKIMQLKKRAEGKSFIVLLENENDLAKYVKDVPPLAYELIEFSEKPLTIIYPTAKNIAPSAVNADGSIGIRITKHPFLQALIRKVRKPIVSTSANISGNDFAKNFDDINQELLNGVDYAVNLYRHETFNQPSTILKLGVNGEIQIIRK